jgi:phage baseplate assembly protein W
MVDIERERELLRERMLGWSPACELVAPRGELSRDLRLVSGPNGIDLARVSGMENLGQSLAIALTTRLGDDVFNVRFGFDGLNALVDEMSPILTRERIRVAVIQVLRKDPRVRRIVDVQLDDGRLTAPTGAGRRELDVRVSFETVASDQATIQMGRVITNA